MGILATPIREMDRPMNDRPVQVGELLGVGLDRWHRETGLHELDRYPDHVVPTLPRILPPIDRLDSVRPCDGIAPGIMGPRRRRIAGSSHTRTAGIIEQPGAPVLAR